MYNYLFPKYHNRYFHLLYALQDLEPYEGKTLDVGCAVGGITSEIAQNRPDLQILGCDKDRSYIREFNKKFGQRMRSVYCDVQHLSFSDSNFDIVLVFDVLEHVPFPEKAISEISRILREGGVFHLVVPLEGSLFTIDGWIRFFFRKNLKKEPIGHIQQFTYDDIHRLLTSCGFQIQNVRFSYYFFYQFFSFLYYFYVALFKKGKYFSLPTPEKQGIGNRSIFSFIILGGWLVYWESFLLSRFHGQTVHITATKSNL